MIKRHFRGKWSICSLKKKQQGKSLGFTIVHNILKFYLKIYRHEMRMLIMAKTLAKNALGCNNTIFFVFSEII